MLVLFNRAFRPYKCCVVSFVERILRVSAILKYHSWFWKLKIKLETSVGLKMVVFYIKYEHQINWANVCDTNLDNCTGRSVRNGRIDLLSTSTLNLSRNGWKIRRCTLYNHKNSTTNTSCTILAACYALLLSVSVKPTFVVIAPLYAELGLVVSFHRHG